MIFLFISWDDFRETIVRRAVRSRIHTFLATVSVFAELASCYRCRAFPCKAVNSLRQSERNTIAVLRKKITCRPATVCLLHQKACGLSS